MRSLRTDADLTLAEVSARSDLSVSYVADIEHDRTVPSLRALSRLAGALGLSAVDLLRGVTPYDEVASPDE